MLLLVLLLMLLLLLLLLLLVLLLGGRVDEKTPPCPCAVKHSKSCMRLKSDS